MKKSNNIIENINLDLAVEIIRKDIGYTKAACIAENLSLASFLREMGVSCTFKFGEAVFFPTGSSTCFVHRNLTSYGRIKGDRKCLHFWLDVDEKVLDISVGTWTHGYPSQFKKEYLYADYSKGFDFETATSLWDVDFGNGDQAHCYRPFDIEKRTKRIIPDIDCYRTNMTMYQDLDLEVWMKKDAMKYVREYRKLISPRASKPSIRKNIQAGGYWQPALV